MEAVHTSETSVYSSATTRRYIPEGSHLHTRRRENLKSHILLIVLLIAIDLYVVRLELLGQLSSRNWSFRPFLGQNEFTLLHCGSGFASAVNESDDQ
jgi:hypothetical protein